jgi:GTP-binding protein
LLADVGLVGFPNAGKSTLISRISAARPKIADYPFTTLEPHLGVVNAGDYRSFVVADIPGLIEGAHQGAGLGDRFLRHLERCALLLHLVDPTSGQDPIRSIDTIRGELEQYGSELATRPQILILTKADAVQDASVLRQVVDYAEARGLPYHIISAVTGEGIRKLIRDVLSVLDRIRASAATEKENLR